MFYELMQSIKAARTKWIVVFSAGQESPDERDRVVDLLGEDPFPNSDWINLHYALVNCREIKASIRDHRYVWFQNDRTRTRYSLEALEREFSIVRPRSLRSHSYCYLDLEGETGDMEVLALARSVRDGSASEAEELSLKGYCTADVKNMFEIAYSAEQQLYSSAERRLRRRLYS
jgi:hypothetical protein